jgi:hypothetical protein
MLQPRHLLIGIAALVMGLGWAAPARSAPFTISQGAFSGSQLIDFGLIETFAPIHGMTIDGVTFQFHVGGLPSLDAVIDGGPGITNNISPANIEGPVAGVLTIQLPSPQFRLGYGYATDFPPGGTSVELFDASLMSLGSITVASSPPDPTFPGGFLGLGSDVAFTSAEVRFFTAASDRRFVLDNLTFDNVPVPEPATFTLLGYGALFVLARGLLVRPRRRT